MLGAWLPLTLLLVGCLASARSTAHCERMTEDPRCGTTGEQRPAEESRWRVARASWSDGRTSGTKRKGMSDDDGRDRAAAAWAPDHRRACRTSGSHRRPDRAARRTGQRGHPRPGLHAVLHTLVAHAAGGDAASHGTVPLGPAGWLRGGQVGGRPRGFL